jgi:propanol-preferring alcohol dehydrogenase
MIASGVCRSDHSILHDEKPRPWFQQKFTLCHEGCGRIVQIGSEVTDKKFQVVRSSSTLLVLLII